MKDYIAIQTALFSVTNKEGLKTFSKGIRKHNTSCEFIASGGTAKHLADGDISYTPLHEYTGFPECFNGRVKTLNPKVFGGILFRRGIDDEEAKKLKIKPIDLIVCNLYDFKHAAQDKNAPITDIIEWMDIGGSTLIRSACKNFPTVTVIVDPNDYPNVLKELNANEGKISLKTRERLAVKAMNLSADYEALIAREFGKRLLNEETRRPQLTGGRELPYGENPDQKAWVYNFADQDGLSQAKQLAGKDLSFNNYEDGSVAYYAAQELIGLNAKHGISIIKHGSLCAYATGDTLCDAFNYAWEGDSKSAFGSVIASTSEVGMELSAEIKNKFIEVLIAPKFSKEFVKWVIKSKPRLRLLEAPNQLTSEVQYKNISGGMLVQTRKGTLQSSDVDKLFHSSELENGKKIGVVTKKAPSENQKGLFAFGISAVNFAKSNAVAIVREPKPGIYQLLGMGAGQPNRVDSLERLAIPKAVENLQTEHKFNASYDPKVDLSTCVIASDGFFPFDDSIRYAATSGIKYCIQPGGSKRDPEVIQAANELEMCMVFTGERYFYH